MTTYWAQTLSLLLTVIFLLTFEQKLKVLKMPAPTIQLGSAARPDVGRRLEHVGSILDILLVFKTIQTITIYLRLPF